MVRVLSGLCVALLVGCTTTGYAQEANGSRFGLGYYVGNGSGISLLRATHDHLREATLSLSHSSNDQMSSALDANDSLVPASLNFLAESAMLGLSYYWIYHIDSNLSLLCGPHLGFGGTLTKVTPSLPAVEPAYETSYYTTVIQLNAGPQYSFNEHFAIAGVTSANVSIQGRARTNVRYFTTHSTNYYLGASLSARYFF